MQVNFESRGDCPSLPSVPRKKPKCMQEEIVLKWSVRCFVIISVIGFVCYELKLAFFD